MASKEEFFNPYLCVVCKSKASFSSAKVCSGCKLLSYCSSEHQKADWENHKRFCKTVKKVCRENRVTDIFEIEFSSMEVFFASKLWDLSDPYVMWQKRKQKAFLDATCQMTRKPRQIEEFAVYRPKFCKICFSRNVMKELVCTQCFFVGYCSAEHQSLDNHAAHCEDYKKALDMDLFMSSKNIEFIKIPTLKPGQLVNLKGDMKAFIASISPGLSYEMEAFISFYYSDVLTFAYVITKIPKFTVKKKLTVHIVGAETDSEGKALCYWETLFNIFPKLKAVSLCLIGPFTNVRQPCKKKLSDGRHIEFSFHKEYYHDFYNSGVRRPDAIIAYNCGLHTLNNMRGDTWSPSLGLFVANDNVPFIFTAWKKN